MTDKILTVAARTARYLLVAAAAGYLLIFLVVAAWRLQHPFELEWMEGAMVEHVQRVVAGDRIYVPPSLDFVPFIYPPGFYYASAAMAQVTGVGFPALRLVSLLSSLGVFALLYLFVARDTRDRFAAVAAVGLFAATYRIGGTFFDVGRVDALFLVLLFGALFVLRFHGSVRAHALGGLLIGLAFLTKQSALVMAAPVVLYAIYRAPRRGLVTAAIAGVVGLGATVLLDAAHAGWYRFYTLEIPSGYPLLPQRLVDFWRVDVLPPLAIAWAVGAIYFAAPRPGSPRLFYLAVAIGALAGSWLSRGNPGGYSNVLIPAFLLSSLLFGLGMHAARVTLAGRASAARVRGETWLGAVCLAQLALLAYNPRYELPKPTDAAAGLDFVRRVASVEGEVWIPYHGYLAAMAGKRPHAHWMAVSDILASGHDSVRRQMASQINEALRKHRFDLIVESTRPFADAPSWDAFYARSGDALHDHSAFWPVTGAPRRVETLYVPREAADGTAAIGRQPTFAGSTADGSAGRQP